MPFQAKIINKTLYIEYIGGERTYNKRRILCAAIIAVFFTLLILNPCQIILAKEKLVKVNVHAKACDGNIIVSGKILLKGLESIDSVEITLQKPDGDVIVACNNIYVEEELSNNNVTIFSYTYVFESCVSEKGIYEVTVRVICSDLEATATFKFDPPGGTPGVPNS